MIRWLRANIQHPGRVCRIHDGKQFGIVLDTVSGNFVTGETIVQRSVLPSIVVRNTADTGNPFTVRMGDVTIISTLSC